MGQIKWNPSENAHTVIVCAANRNRFTKHIICGARHWDNIMRTQAKKIPFLNYVEWEQGFIDQFGKFYNRKEAMNIVGVNNQPFNYERNGHQAEELYSEGLY